MVTSQPLPIPANQFAEIPNYTKRYISRPIRDRIDARVRVRVYITVMDIVR